MLLAGFEFVIPVHHSGVLRCLLNPQSSSGELGAGRDPVTFGVPVPMCHCF